ncbi:SDR family NAD(P)-dependent oxidoreductase [Vulcanibacillus modesticaldus]|nr:SDR family oxidoreductase [Vulcanibacillus modesticaldus]
MLKDKVVVITGASSGVGAEIAKLLAQKGATTLLMARSLEKLKKVSSQIEGKHEIYQMDVTSTEQVFQTMDDVLSKYGKIDILINNAGFGVFDYFIDASLKDYEEMMDTNYMGMVRCTKAVLPSMLKRNSGHIINIASVAGKLATAKSAGYSATKFAMIGFANSLRHELVDTKIFVSSVNPGPIDTPFFDIADPSGSYVKNIKWLMLTPEQVANEVLDVIISKKSDKTIPFFSRVGVKLYHMFPNTFDKLLGKMMNQK